MPRATVLNVFVVGTVAIIWLASKLIHSCMAVSLDLPNAAKVSKRSVFSGIGMEQLTKPSRIWSGAQLGCSHNAIRAISS